MNANFSFNRLGLLIKRYFVENKKSELMLFAIYALVMLFIQDKSSWYALLFVGGIFYAAKQFKAFENATSGMQYLLLPATQAEKTVSAILISSVYYFIMVVVAYLLSNLIGYGIYELHILPAMISESFFNSSFDLFDNYQGEGGIVYNNTSFFAIVWLFLIGQSVFLLGALYFNKNVVFKTILAQFVIGLIFSILISVVLKIVFGNFSINIGPDEIYYLNNLSVSSAFEIFVKASIFALVPFFWIVSYFRLTEKEV